MKSLTIYGASDDLIEVEGHIRDEFTYVDDENNYLSFSDGTILKIRYDDEGCWRITTFVLGTATISKVEAEGEDSENYSDRVTLTGDFKWVMHGTNIATMN